MDKRTEAFERFAGEQVFIKETAKGPANLFLSSAQKAELNRKGNALLNGGDVEGARRVFLTTGYSDGLSRVGDAYKKQGRVLDALNLYLRAPDRGKANEVYLGLALLIKGLIHEEGV